MAVAFRFRLLIPPAIAGLALVVGLLVARSLAARAGALTEDASALGAADEVHAAFAARVASLRENPVVDPGRVERLGKVYDAYYALARATTGDLARGVRGEAVTAALRRMTAGYSETKALLSNDTTEARARMTVAESSAVAARQAENVLAVARRAAEFSASGQASTQQGQEALARSMQDVVASAESLRQLGRIIEETSEAATQIAGAVKHQTAGVSEITTAVGSLDAGMGATLAGMEDVDRAAADLHGTAARIGAVVEEFRI